MHDGRSVAHPIRRNAPAHVYISTDLAERVPSGTADRSPLQPVQPTCGKTDPALRRSGRHMLTRDEHSRADLAGLRP